MVGGIEDEGERRLEPGVDLGRVGDERQVGRDQRDDRGDAEAGDGAVMVGLAEDADAGGVEGDLLPRLAQRGGCGVFALVEAAAGEGDLPAMVAQGRGCGGSG